MKKLADFRISRFLLGFLVFILLFLPATTYGQLNNPFGGFVVFVKPCTASFNEVITMIPAKPGLPPQVIYQPLISQLFAFYQIRPGVNVLGTWLGIVPCLQFVPFPPFIIPDPLTPVLPLVKMIGTSGGTLPDAPTDGDYDSSPPPDESRPACSDSLDNDHDGLIDYPNDPECQSATDQSEEADTCSCNCNAQNEEETRTLLRSLGIGINKSACRRDPDNICLDAQRENCTNVRCLPRTAIDKLRNLKAASRCNIIITGGTEPGHQTHGQCRAIVDLGLNNCLDAYIRRNATAVRDVGYGIEHRLPDGRYVREINHWHVIY